MCCGPALLGSTAEYSDAVQSAPPYTLAVRPRPAIHHDVSPSLSQQPHLTLHYYPPHMATPSVLYREGLVRMTV